MDICLTFLVISNLGKLALIHIEHEEFGKIIDLKMSQNLLALAIHIPMGENTTARDRLAFYTFCREHLLSA